MSNTMSNPQMNVSLTPELAELVDERVESGHYVSRSEVMRESLRLLEERDHLREWKRERLRELIKEGIESGEATPLDMGEIKREARAEWEQAKESSEK
jgi:antitoxin ParD1/3/4